MVENKMEHIHKTWYSLLFKQKNIFFEAFLVVLSVAILGVLANIQIPLWPVPITMQTFGIFLIAFFFGSWRAAITLLTYIVAGVVGFGVFAGHSSGLSVFYSIKEGALALGPSAGYIIGFVFAAFAVGLLIEKGYGRNWKSILLVLLVGEVIIYAFGLPWLWMALPQLSFWQVLMAGLIPFLVGDTIKAIAAMSLFPYMWKGVKKISR